MSDPTPPEDDINPDDEYHGLPIQYWVDDRRPKDDSDILELIANLMRAINA